MFIIVLSNSEYKKSYPQELNFQEKIRDDTVNFTILHNPPGQRKPNGQNTLGFRHDPNTVFVTMFLPTTISSTAVKKASTNFGDVHAVFAGAYKEQFKRICNGKRHVRLTPFHSNQDLPHKIQFGENRKFFHVMWTEKNSIVKSVARFTC